MRLARTPFCSAFRQVVSTHEYDALGEDFEKKDHQLFSEGGFEKNVALVASLEKKLAIYDLPSSPRRLRLRCGGLQADQSWRRPEASAT